MSCRAPWVALSLSLALWFVAQDAAAQPALVTAQPSRATAQPALVAAQPSSLTARPDGATPGSAAPAPEGYSAAGLYNAANSYARAGKTSLAVLYYQRARLLQPNDADIDANLRFVRNAAGLAPEAPRWFDAIATIASPITFYIIGVFGLAMAGCSFLALRRYSRHRLKLATGLVFGSLMVGIAVRDAVTLWSVLHEAVVLTAATPARVSPVPLGDPLFVLPEAETVTVTAKHEGYVLVETHGGRAGWVAETSIVPVVPR